jgi:putative FmdB family regulatory protein
MPLYEYECKQCRKHLEKIQSFSAAPETVCPSCGGKLERVISAPAFRFKGAGWYVTDYAKSKSTSSGWDSDGASDKKTHTKTESQPEGTSAAKPSTDHAAPAASSGETASNSSTTPAPAASSA